MIKLDTKNSALPNLSEHASKIPEYLKKIEERDQGFYKIVDDSVDAILDFAKSVEGKYDDVVVLGIGGSALGMLCLQDSLKPISKPKLHILDNIDPSWLSGVEVQLNFEKTLFIVVSKSGGTPETISQYFYFRKKCDDAGLEVKDHFVFITGSEGLLREHSKKDGIKTFNVPENVGGRFSVLTAVSLLPAALIGIDIKQLLSGAKEMRDKFLSESFDENLPFQIATMQYLHGKKNRNMIVMFPYSEKLIRFSSWHGQLLAESIGKKSDIGLTPVSALGVTDQHSQSQLYMDGPDDKFFIFIKVEKLGPKLEIPVLDDRVHYLEGVTFDKLMHTEMEGTIRALTHNGKPNITITIPEVNEKSLGQLFMLFEGATAFLGEFYGINAFDQPGVELSKKLTKELLTNK